MIQLPSEMRETLIEQLDEYIDSLSDSPDPEAVASEVVNIIETVAEEYKLEEADDIIVKMENSGELEASLVEVLEENFESDEEFDRSGLDLVRMLERLCDIEWTSQDEDEEDEDDDDDDDPDSFFDDMGGDEDDE
jgi:hypothetical protein